MSKPEKRDIKYGYTYCRNCGITHKINDLDIGYTRNDGEMITHSRKLAESHKEEGCEGKVTVKLFNNNRRNVVNMLV